MPRTVATFVASIDTSVLLLALLALTMTTLVDYDDNVSILLALMVAVVAIAELVTAVQVPTSSPALSLFHTCHPTNYYNEAMHPGKISLSHHVE